MSAKGPGARQRRRLCICGHGCNIRLDRALARSAPPFVNLEETSMGNRDKQKKEPKKPKQPKPPKQPPKS